MITEKKNIFGYEVADLLIKVSSKEEYLKDTPLYNFFIKKYRTGLSDV